MLVRRLVYGMCFVIVLPLLAVVPLGGLRSALTGAPAKPKPVTPAVQHLDITPATGAMHSALAQPRPSQIEQNTGQFSMVSATWQKGTLPAGASLQVETRDSHTGAWSTWRDLDVTDSGPDPGSADARAAAAVHGTDQDSEAVWAGHADGVRLRVTGANTSLPAHLKLTLVDPGTSPADAHPGGTDAVAHAATAQQPTIYTRADWGADESLRTVNPGCGTPQYSSTIKAGIVHHTVTSNDYSESDVPSIIRSIYAYHVYSNGWCDIGYNFLIDKFGRIWEGRYGGIDQPVLGAQAGGFNTDTFGVSLIGNYETDAGGTTPTPAMLDALESLLAWKLGMYGRDATGTTVLTSAGTSYTAYPAGTNVTVNVISGHRDVDLTSCPGNAVYDQLSTVRQATKLLELGAALVDPKVLSDFSPTNGSVVISSGMLSSGTWQLDIADAAGNPVRTLSGSGSSVYAVWDRKNSAGSLVPNGTYKLTLSSTQNGIAAVPWSTNIVLGRSIGALNQAFATAGRIIVQGWVLRDRTSDPTPIHVVVGGGFSGTAMADLPRGDVQTNYPQWGLYHGYDVTVPAASGMNTVCVYGVNEGIPESQIGCWNVDVPAPAIAATNPTENPFGSLDATTVTAPGTLAIRGWAIDPDTRGGIDADVYVDGHGMTRLLADQSRPDVGQMFAGYGARHGFSTTLNLAGGPHQVCVYGINVGAGSGNPAMACRNVTLPTGPPRGSLDAVTMTGIGQVLVRGWSLDPDTVDPTRVDIYVDGQGATSVQANGDRPDIASYYPIYGSKHGFQTTLSLAGGKHQVCAYGINLGPAAGNTLLGCRSVTLPTGMPFGSYDVATMTAPGQVLVRGWAIDPDSVDPVRIDFYVDGHGLTSTQADQSRPDVAGLYPLYGDKHGFQTTLNLPGGKHSICAYAINLGPAAGNPLLGCRTVTLPTGSPFGSFDSATPTGAGHVEVRGWAIDPDIAGSVRVDFYIDGKGAASVQADQARPDIASAFPAYGADHGFDTTLSVAAGKHTVCAYAINVAGGAPNTQLACLAFTSS